MGRAQQSAGGWACHGSNEPACKQVYLQVWPPVSRCSLLPASRLLSCPQDAAMFPTGSRGAECHLKCHADHHQASLSSHSLPGCKDLACQASL